MESIDHVQKNEIKFPSFSKPTNLNDNIVIRNANNNNDNNINKVFENKESNNELFDFSILNVDTKETALSTNNKDIKKLKGVLSEDNYKKLIGVDNYVEELNKNVEKEIKNVDKQISDLKSGYSIYEAGLKYSKGVISENDMEKYTGVKTKEEYDAKLEELKNVKNELKNTLYNQKELRKQLPYLYISGIDEYKNFNYSDKYDYNVAYDEVFIDIKNLDLSKSAQIKQNLSNEEYKEFQDTYCLGYEDRKMYFYLKSLDKEKANDFLKSKEDKINQVKGTFEAQKFLSNLDENKVKNYYNTFNKGFDSGFESFFEGLWNLVLPDGVRSAKDYEKIMISQALANNKEYGKYLPETYQFSMSMGNMAPSIAASMLASAAVVPAASAIDSSVFGLSAEQIGQYTGVTLMGMSAAGNATEGSLQEGNSLATSYLYGSIIGLSEASLEHLIGNIPGLSSSASMSVKGLLSEGLEEGSQEVIDSVVRNALFGEEIDAKELGKRSKDAFAMGVLMSLVMNGGQATIATTANSATMTYDDFSNLYNNGGTDAIFNYLSKAENNINENSNEIQNKSIDKNLIDMNLQFFSDKSKSSANESSNNFETNDGYIKIDSDNLIKIRNLLRSQVGTYPYHDIQTIDDYLNNDSSEIKLFDFDSFLKNIIYHLDVSFKYRDPNDFKNIDSRFKKFYSNYSDSYDKITKIRGFNGSEFEFDNEFFLDKLFENKNFEEFFDTYLEYTDNYKKLCYIRDFDIAKNDLINSLEYFETKENIQEFSQTYEKLLANGDFDGIKNILNVTQQKILDRWSNAVTNVDEYEEGKPFRFICHSTGSSNFKNNFETRFVSTSLLTNNLTYTYREGFGFIFDPKNIIAASSRDMYINNYAAELDDIFNNYSSIPKISPPDRLIKECFDLKRENEINHKDLDVYNEVLIDGFNPSAIFCVIDGTSIGENNYEHAKQLKEQFPDLKIIKIPKDDRVSLDMEDPLANYKIKMEKDGKEEVYKIIEKMELRDQVDFIRNHKDLYGKVGSDDFYSLLRYVHPNVVKAFLRNNPNFKLPDNLMHYLYFKHNDDFFLSYK